MVDFTQARQNMVDCQLRTNKIVDDGLIDAFLNVPRELFVDPDHLAVAYTDIDVPVGNERKMVEPMVLANLIQAVSAQPHEVALDVGCGTGYSSAILAHLVTTVVALETDKELATKANNNFTNLAVDNAVVVEGELNQGYATQGPYDIICIAGSVPAVPKTLTDQLAEGGRLCAVVDDGTGQGKAVLVLNRNDEISQRVLFDISVFAMPGFEVEKGFEF
ncbi:MAG: protein-L-isoaspartate O-methyltransferase [Rhodospirillaceae bacterium]|nr:protein-L-isoaspartate O-methyltransferase [Rhodospirillaceae bacterium]|tara:strand:+ start:6481 stop:7137 length:657 start_codon:yes stop_codon:yes gene_type:complete